jgi:hypothetical protein
MYHTAFSPTYSDLPTAVDRGLWIAVDKCLFGWLFKKAVDKIRNSRPVMHSLSTKVWDFLVLESQSLKKELDHLSTYPQRLLLLLNKS